MAVRLARDVRLGRRFPGLEAVGYTLTHPFTGATIQARREVAVTEFKPGRYAADLDFPAAVDAVLITWDVPDSDPPVTASEVLDFRPESLLVAPPGGGPAASLRPGLYAYLRASDQLEAIVGARVYPGTIPQGQGTPALTYEVTSDEEVRDLSGVPTGHQEARVAFGCWGTSPAACVALSAALRNTLRGLTPGGADGDLGGVIVRWCRRDPEQEQSVPLQDESDNKRWVLEVDYTINYRES